MALIFCLARILFRLDLGRLLDGWVFRLQVLGIGDGLQRGLWFKTGKVPAAIDRRPLDFSNSLRNPEKIPQCHGVRGLRDLDCTQ